MERQLYKKIVRMDFGVLSPKEIKKMAVAKVVTPELYDKEGYPVDGGLMDIRLGVIDPGLRCKTCGEKLKECVGHFGHIELARPIIHIKYVRVLMDFLRSTCRECSRILLEDKTIEKYRNLLEHLEKTNGLEVKRKKVRELINSIKNIKKCPHCKAKQLTVKLEKPSTFIEGDKRVTPIEIRTRFEKIPDGDVEILGLNPKYARPDWLILTVLLIPPVTMRPSITLETGERSEDDLTHKLGDVVRINQRLFENINAGAPEIIVEDLWDLLQYHVTTYFDNTVTQIPPARHRSGQLLKTLTERLKSKEGRFRYNLAGKRVNFAARTVISPDPEIGLNEVGIPLSVAMDITVPERVTEWNMKWLKEFINKGPTNYPGSNYVLRPDGKKKKITDETREQLIEELQPGYVVERHLMDGDTVVFNRQPSLHKMSIMCHKVRIIPGRSFRLNPNVCFPYNADFDGDEMNLHVPQTEEAIAEADVLMQVQTQIITPKNGLNVIGVIEDSISGCYLLTKEMTLTKENAIELLISIGIDSGFEKFKSTVSGKEVFGVLLPDDFNFVGETKGKQPLVIKKGKIVEGYIDVNAVGEEKGALIREIYKKYGPTKTLEVIDKIAKLGVNVLLKRGFSSGLSDTDLDEELKKKIQQQIDEAKAEVDELIKRYNKGELDALPSRSVEETLEIMILQNLNKIRNKVGDLIATSVKEKNNHTIIMARSGARGNILNLAMMAAVVGQQALRGKRIKSGYDKRTLTLFKKDDKSPKSRGFIDVGFKKGLDPVQFFFGAMTGRDSLMDTALRTPKSGYLYRRLANALQDLKVEYDGTVRDATKTIIQFSYGDDNIDVSKSDGGTIDVKRIVKVVAGEE